MKVILMTDVPALGHRGETRDVANGYARNFLLPRKLAVPATPANLKNVEHLKRQRAREEHQALEAAKAAAVRVEGLTLAVTARAHGLIATDAVQVISGKVSRVSLLLGAASVPSTGGAPSFSTGGRFSSFGGTSSSGGRASG